MQVTLKEQAEQAKKDADRAVYEKDRRETNIKQAHVDLEDDRVLARGFVSIQ